MLFWKWKLKILGFVLNRWAGMQVLVWAERCQRTHFPHANHWKMSKVGGSNGAVASWVVMEMESKTVWQPPLHANRSAYCVHTLWAPWTNGWYLHEWHSAHAATCHAGRQFYIGFLKQIRAISRLFSYPDPTAAIQHIPITYQVFTLSSFQSFRCIQSRLSSMVHC